jgi:hypothetical protein
MLCLSIGPFLLPFSCAIYIPLTGYGSTNLVAQSVTHRISESGFIWPLVTPSTPAAAVGSSKTPGGSYAQ